MACFQLLTASGGRGLCARRLAPRAPGFWPVAARASASRLPSRSLESSAANDLGEFGQPRDLHRRRVRHGRHCVSRDVSAGEARHPSRCRGGPASASRPASSGSRRMLALLRCAIWGDSQIKSNHVSRQQGRILRGGARRIPHRCRGGRAISRAASRGLAQWGHPECQTRHDGGRRGLPATIASTSSRRVFSPGGLGNSQPFTIMLGVPLRPSRLASDDPASMAGKLG